MVATFNRPSGWRRFYALEPFFAVALDTLGWPIGLREDDLARLNPATGVLEPLGASMAGLHDRLHKGRVGVGLSVAQRWKQSFILLAPQERLVPSRPRALGGILAVSNLRTWDLRRMEHGSERSLSWPPGRPG